MTLDQINDMKHCIGYDPRYVKRGKYKMYRNYYNAAEEKDAGWEKLVSQGYAKRFNRNNQIIYFVTESGLSLLENILDVKIIQGD